MSKARQLADLNTTSLADLSDNSISGALDVGSLTIGGTEVIDSSRNLSNIAGGFKTVNGTSLLGSGDISAGGISTTYAAVDTYVFATIPGSYSPNNGGTIAGSALSPANSNNRRPVSLSGTWRVMGAAGYISGGTSPTEAYARTLYLRIS